MTIVPQLTSGVIHIWQAPLTQTKNQLDTYWQLLDQDEQKRARRFVQIQHCNNFIAARGILRNLLAAYLQCKPQSITFYQNKFGKLSLVDTSSITIPTKFALNSSLQFNLSHSGNMAIYAFTLDKQIGIDLEHTDKKVETDDIAKRYFTTQEQSAFFAIPQHLRSLAFFNCWTRKEAFIKALGKGLAYPLNNFSVDLSLANTIAKLNLQITDPDLLHTDWSLFNLTIHPEYCAALVVENQCNSEQIALFNYPLQVISS